MPIWVELRRADSTPVRAVVDPSGGRFDAAGDFDRFIGRAGLTVLGRIDPHKDTALTPSEMPKLLREIEIVLDDANGGPETRGLLRLRVLAQLCREDESSRLLFVGD